jgi:DNA adenine methylase
MVIYEVPHMFSRLERAWAFWTATTQGFSNKIGSWRSNSLTGKENSMLFNKKMSFTQELAERLSHVQIENKDAIELISDMDSEQTFFYIDPPYVNSNQGHYSGYTQEHFNALLERLSSIKGKFLLSSYPNDKLVEMQAQCGWQSKAIDKALSTSNKLGKRKQEVLTWNYEV